MASPCAFILPTGAACEAKRSAPIHLRITPNHHAYEDPSKAGMRAVSEGRDAYLRSQTHKDAYRSGTGVCAFEAAGVATVCYGPWTKHHTFPRGRAGGLERAERLAPVVDACAMHNTWATESAEGLAWSELHFVHVDGRDWPLVMTAAMAREIEEAVK